MTLLKQNVRIPNMVGIPNKFYIGSFPVYFYGIIIAIGMIVALIICANLLPKHGIKKEVILDLAIWAIPFGIVGARLFYVLFSGYSFSFAEVFNLRTGGMSILGAVSLGAVGVFIACKIKKVSFIKVADCALPAIILAQAIGRWGNFFNQEAYGMLITNSSFQFFPFGVLIGKENWTALASEEVIKHFGTYNIESAWFNATFFYEFIWNVLGFVLLLILFLKLSKKGKTGIVMAVYFVWYGFGRFFIEMLRLDPLVIFGSIRFSQWLAFAEMILGIVLLVLFILKDKKGKKNV